MVVYIEMTCDESSKVLARKGCIMNNLSLYNSFGVTQHSFLLL
jgi:hypothetical protein